MKNIQLDSSIKVSIIIPTYNTAPNKLKKTIDTVLNQTESKLELIIIDDGSDLPFSGIQNYYNDPRIIFLKNNNNIGPAKTRNRGIEIAKAPYIAFLDTGDHWFPKKLEKQLTLITSSKNIDMVFCGARFNIQGIVSYDSHPPRHDDWYVALLTGQPITGSASAVLVDANVCKNLCGFHTQEDIPEDREFWLRIAKDYRIDFVNEILTVIEVLEDSRGSDPFKKEITYRHFIDLHSEEMKKKGVYKKSLAHYHASISHLYFRKGVTVRGIKHIIISLFLWPRRSRLKRLYYYLCSMITEGNYLKRVIKAEYSTDNT